MMKVKIFKNRVGVAESGEDAINEWFESNPNISIFKIKIVTNKWDNVTHIYYSDTVKL